MAAPPPAHVWKSCTMPAHSQGRRHGGPAPETMRLKSNVPGRVLTLGWWRHGKRRQEGPPAPYPSMVVVCGQGGRRRRRPHSGAGLRRTSAAAGTLRPGPSRSARRVCWGAERSARRPSQKRIVSDMAQEVHRRARTSQGMRFQGANMTPASRFSGAAQQGGTETLWGKLPGWRGARASSPFPRSKSSLSSPRLTAARAGQMRLGLTWATCPDKIVAAEIKEGAGPSGGARSWKDMKGGGQQGDGQARTVA